MKSIPTKQAAPKVGTPKSWTVHHPSCRESDRDLVWHCSQCGLNESAAELEAAAQKLAEALCPILNALESGYLAQDSVAAERNRAKLEQTAREVLREWEEAQKP